MPLNDFVISPGKTAKYLQLANWFENRIRSGEFASGERLPSSRQLARQLKLSTITTTAALNELHHRNLVVRRHGSGTYVAASRELERRLRIGFLSPATGTTYAQKMIGCLWESSNHHGCDLVALCRSADEAETAVADFSLDGLLIYNHDIPVESIRHLNSTGIPSLLISSVMEDASECSVGYSNEWLLRDAVAYLSDLGHTRIGFVSDSLDSQINRWRQESFLTAMWERCLPVNPAWLLAGQCEDGKFAGYLNQAERPTAVILGIRTLAEGFCRALTGTGIRVPEELSVLCIDEPDDAEKLMPRLSRFRIDVAGFSCEAVSQLLQLIRHETPIRSGNRNYEFFDAGSCAAPTGG